MHVFFTAGSAVKMDISIIESEQHKTICFGEKPKSEFFTWLQTKMYANS